MVTFRQFADDLKDVVPSVAATFTEPDDDWQPFLFFECNGRLLTQRIPASFLASDANKDLLADLIVAIARKLGAKKIAMVTSSWIVTAAANETTRVRPSEHPDRREVVMLAISDAERSEFWLASIVRDGTTPPRLGKWEMPSMDIGGRFVEAMQEALR